MYIGVRAKHPLFYYSKWHFNFLERFFEKILKYQRSWKSAQWERSCSMRTDRQTDVTKIIVAFRNSAKAPQKLRDFWDYNINCTENWVIVTMTPFIWKFRSLELTSCLKFKAPILQKPDTEPEESNPHAEILLHSDIVRYLKPKPLTAKVRVRG